jgi:Flp pilus assembly protein TadB
MRSSRVPPPYLSPLEPGRSARRRSSSRRWTVAVLLLVSFVAALALEAVTALTAAILVLALLGVVLLLAVLRPLG